MLSFKKYINEDMQSEKHGDLQKIWLDIFQSLGISGLSDEDAAQQSLSKINYSRSHSEDPNSIFKGKQAVRKRLENGQIFSRITQLSDPEMTKNLEITKKWLDTDDASNSSTTISVLLQKLFGQEKFQQLIDSKFPKLDSAKAQVQPMPPKNTSEPDLSSPDNSMAPNSQALDPQFNPKSVQHPLPPKPIGAENGLF